MIRFTGYALLLYLLFECMGLFLSKLHLIFVLSRYKSDFSFELHELLVYLAIGVFVLLCFKFGSKFFCHQKKHNSPDLTQILQSRIPGYQILRKLLLVLALVLTGINFTHVAYFGFHNGINCLAFGFDRMQMYELAESIYKLNFYRDLANCQAKFGYSTLGTYKNTCSVESDAEIEKRNSAIEKVYGKDSIEMAARYDYLARTFNYEYLVRDAVYWSHRSIAAYERIGLIEKSASSYARLALLEQNSYESYRYYLHGLNLVNQTDNRDLHFMVLLDLQLSAESFQDFGTAVDLRERAQIVSAEESKRPDSRLLFWRNFGDCPYYLIALWIGMVLAKVCALELLSRRLKRENGFESLNHLITIELSRNNLERADLYSKELLARAFIL